MAVSPLHVALERRVRTQDQAYYLLTNTHYLRLSTFYYYLHFLLSTFYNSWLQSAAFVPKIKLIIAFFQTMGFMPAVYVA